MGGGELAAVTNQENLPLVRDEETARHDSEGNSGLTELVHKDLGKPEGWGRAVRLRIAGVGRAGDWTGFGRGRSGCLVFIGGQSVRIISRGGPRNIWLSMWAASMQVLT